MKKRGKLNPSRVELHIKTGGRRRVRVHIPTSTQSTAESACTLDFGLQCQPVPVCLTVLQLQKAPTQAQRAASATTSISIEWQSGPSSVRPSSRRPFRSAPAPHPPSACSAHLLFSVF